MYIIYVYLLDTLADWEIGYVTSELNSTRFFKKNAPKVMLKTVSNSKKEITTMGGLKIIPDCLIDDINIDDKSVLILPGANIWHEKEHSFVIEKAKKILEVGGVVAAICGATVALADYGLFDKRKHTSNGVGS